MFKRLLLALIAFLLLPLTAYCQVQAEAFSACGTLYSAGQYGPYDYRTDKDKLPIVLGAHFTPEVEALVRGKSGSVGGDIDYTLRAIPNNHRALIAMMRLAEKQKTQVPVGSRYTIQCWFERALLFRPDDSIVRMIYSQYLHSQGRFPEANGQLAVATASAKDSAFTHYNIGLHYFDLKNYDMALVQAHKAMELGFTQTALRDQLISVGKWVEPAVAESLPASDASTPTTTNK
jgi:tetratricopeptide (TPR) repeat protein